MNQNPEVSDFSTIVAEATPAGRGGIGIIRLSGPDVVVIGTALVGKLPDKRVAVTRFFKTADGSVIDQGLVLYFQGPASFTGEDVLELHGHGGPVVMSILLRRCIELGARQARPGEFSERAFLNNKIDLVQAEAVADLIDSASEAAARNAVKSLQGAFSRKINGLVEKLTQLRIFVEASIDFPEEEEDFLADKNVIIHLQGLIAEVASILSLAQQGAILQEGLDLVLVGAANSGKSSMMNFLSGQETSIVTEIAGTTRDVIRENIVLDGIPFRVLDTAGIRDSDDPIEREGVRRTIQSIETADAVLWLIDWSVETSQREELKVNPSPDLIHRRLADLKQNLFEGINLEKPLIPVLNKVDLIDSIELSTETAESDAVYFSTKTGQGLPQMMTILKEKLALNLHPDGLFSARRRHLSALELGSEHLQLALLRLTEERAGELMAEELKRAQDALGEITGQLRSDDLLGRIFSSFCIGK